MDITEVHGLNNWKTPKWAILQQQLIDVMDEAALYFVNRYTRNDGTLIWRTEWPGMDGSDDPYEGFQNFPLFYALGGSEDVYLASRKMWDAITWQWTEYGQIYREFDAYYDWMHHGEGLLLFYFFGLADPTVLKDRQRTIRFANFYTGRDANASNYDMQKKMMVAPITGSRGPRFEYTAEDWCTHREVLDHYPPPFEDIPGVPGPTCPWSDDEVYRQVLQLMNERMARGDVPLNLTSTSLATHAYLYTGEELFLSHIFEYLGAWKERTEKNGGIMPDNIGPSGIIGECLGGNWWGGYYGWRWPHGAFNLIESSLIAGSNALLLDGDSRHLDLVRSQLDLLGSLGQEVDGKWHVPHKHKDAGWCDYKPMSPVYPIYCWYLTQDDEDLRRIEDLCSLDGSMEATIQVGKGNIGNTAQWFQYILGKNPTYPEDILMKNLELVDDRLERIRNDNTDPATWDVHHWQDLNPVVCEGLVQLTMGAPMHIYHGGLLHGTLRYYDPKARRPGLPKLVSALVESIHKESVLLHLVNLDPVSEHKVIVQSGTFGEHEIREVQVFNQDGHRLDSVTTSTKWIQVSLGPSTGIRVKLVLSRFKNLPSYETPFVTAADYPSFIKGRSD